MDFKKQPAHLAHIRTEAGMLLDVIGLDLQYVSNYTQDIEIQDIEII